MIGSSFARQIQICYIGFEVFAIFGTHLGNGGLYGTVGVFSSSSNSAEYPNILLGLLSWREEEEREEGENRKGVAQRNVN